MATFNQTVARNVRRYREERALSLGDVARASGLAKQTLSKIESGTGNPTVDTLEQLARALEVPPRQLLTEWGTAVFLVRRDEGEWVDHDHWSERLLDETYGSGYVRTLVVRLNQDDRRRTPQTLPPGTLHHLYVIEGRIRTGPVSEPVDLEAGDFVRFPGDVPHDHVCLSERALAHLVTTLPQIRQLGSGSRS
jgi:transcriptional regulator with XRE-family HTH domain